MHVQTKISLARNCRSSTRHAQDPDDSLARMLHIRNTLLKHKYLEKRYTFKISNLRHCALRVILHLENLPLREERRLLTEPGGAENHIFRIFLTLKCVESGKLATT